jgi:uncharacterized protein YgiM (DUF1202 family)
MKRKRILSALLLATIAGAAQAEDVWIKRSADVRNDQSAAGDLVVAVNKGQRVHVLERSDNWVKVDVNGKTGWVSADTVSSREVKPDTDLIGRGSGAEMSSGAAIKGLQPIAGDYARARSLSKDGLNEMTAIKKSVTPKMLKEFVADGGIESPSRSGRSTDAPK